ncbi:MAG: Ig-like domain repeat protein, partial [Gordonia sp. (in: high G+C Gram-positive bacteria)]|nr:Ig-like domain repeat protein [Gordonia sp. (in: high G+C Gram-positive bacteria)]
MSSPALDPFVPNEYRKRVLAAVERRGGPDASDVFELYDIPVESAGALPDDVVAARIDEVWAFWQKHREHPKYRVLVGRLVAEHETRSAALRFAAARAAQAGVVAARRTVRDAERYRLLDSAIERLQDRYGGIPTSKRAGLDDVGAMGGLTPDEVATRLRRCRTVDDGASTPQSSSTDSSTLTDRRLEQIDGLLSEFNRLRDEAPTPTLFSLLSLTLDDADNRVEVQARTESLSQRARELGAGRIRAVIDELLLHVRDLLLGDPATAAAYTDAMTGRIADFLRPRIRAAVLVEDELLAEDREFLLQEAIDRGAGPVGAGRLIGSIAA